jgi:tetratricopeptide (TPR) repeat protein
MAKKFATDSDIAPLFVHIMALSTTEVLDLKPWIERTERTVSQNPMVGWMHSVLGWGEYRQGHDNRAIERFHRSIETTADYFHVFNWAGLALAHQRAKREADARQWLSKCHQWREKAIRDMLEGDIFDSPFGDNGGNYWAMAYVWLLIREAEEAILGANAADSETLTRRRRDDETSLRLIRARALSVLGIPEKAIEADVLAVLSKRRKPEDLPAARRIASELQERVRKDPADQPQKSALATSLESIGVIQRELGQWNEAVDSLSKALAIREQLVQDSPKDALYQDDLRSTCTSLGLTFQKQRKWPETHRLLQRAAVIGEQLFPESAQLSGSARSPADSLLYLGELYLRLGLWHEASQCFDKSFRLTEPNNLAYWNDRALLLLLENDPNKYAQHCKALVKKFGSLNDPGTAAVVAGLMASTAHQVVDLKPWFESAQKMIDLNPPVHIWWALGRCEYGQGQTDRAIKYYQRSIEAMPDWHAHVFNWAGLAVAHRRAGREIDAREWLAKCHQWRDQAVHNMLEAEIFDSPFGDNGAYGAMGLAWLLIREAEDAILGASRADSETLPRRRRDDETSLRLIRARAFSVLGLPEKGIAELEGIAVPRGDGRLQLERIRCMYELGLLSRQGLATAIDDLLDRFTGSASLWTAAARLELSLGVWRRAEIAYARAFELEPKQEMDRWHDFAYACWQAGDRGAYLRLCARLAKNASAFTDLAGTIGFGHMLLWNQSPGSEVEWLHANAQTLAANSLTNCWPAFVLGVCEYRRGRHEQALAALRKSASVDPTSPTLQLTWLVMAMAHERLGHHAEARQWLEKAVRRVDDMRKVLPEPFNPAILFANEFDWRDFQILRREAEALILYDPGFPTDPFSR